MDPDQRKLQRSTGYSSVSLTGCPPKTKLERMRQQGCSKVLLPRSNPACPEIVLVNTAGGLTGGDKVEFTMSVGNSGSAVATTQSAERIYRSSGGEAVMRNRLEVGREASLAWLPQETILFEGSRVKRTTTAEIDSSSSVLLSESVVFGRSAMGESLSKTSFSDTRIVKRDGKTIYFECFRFADPFQKLTSSAAALRGARAIANVMYFSAEAEDRLDGAKNMNGIEGVEFAASAWNGMLVMRLLSDSAYKLRQALIAILLRFRGMELPRVWAM